MKEKNVEDILLFGGGIIPENDLIRLKEMGVGDYLHPGTQQFEIIKF